MATNVNHSTNKYQLVAELGPAQSQLVFTLVAINKSYMSVLQSTVVVAPVNVIVVFINVVADHIVFNCG